MNEYRDLVDVPLILVNTSFSHPVSISQVLRPTKVIPNSMAPPRLAPPTLGFYASPSVGWPHAGESVSSQLAAKESNGKAESIMDQQATKQPGIVQPTVEKSTVAQSTATQPMTGQSTTKQPSVSQPTTMQTSVSGKTKEEVLLHNLAQLQNSPNVVVLESAISAGFGNWVRGLITMYTIALCRGMGFRGRSCESV